MAQEPSSKDLLEAVKQQESGGRRYDKSGKLLEGPMTKYGTAKGEMQVLDLTTKDPGYGVKPARDDSPDERARVGRDYLAAMVKRYGDEKTALVAYNWGPGNTDRWLKKGGDFSRLPKETQNYVAKVTGSLGSTKLAQAPATTKVKKAGVQQAVYKAAPLSHPMLSQLGPNFQAAMAVSMLADEAEKEGKSEDEPSEAEKMLTQATVQPVALASVDLGYQSPFPEVAPKSNAPAKQQLQAFKHGGVVRMENGGDLQVENKTASLEGADLPVSRSAKELKSYTEAMNPAVKVVTDDLGAGTRGQMLPSQPDILELNYKLTPAEREVTTLHELEHSMDARGGDIYGRPNFAKMGGMDNNYRAYHLMGDDWGPITETVKNMVDNREKLEKFFGRPLDNSYFNKQFYNSVKEVQSPSALFKEQLASLAALEQTTGKFLTQDPEMRELFPNTRMMAVFDALTGPRQTRLDARDLPPHTPVPSYTYETNPALRFIKKALTGENEYGTSYRPFPIKRANGGEVDYFQDPMGAPSAPVTADTLAKGKEFRAADALRMVKEFGTALGSNTESLVRGAVAQVPGAVGDLESLSRKGINFLYGPGGVNVSEKTVAPTSEEIRARVPRITATRPESSGMESMGELMAPGLAKAAAPVAKAAAKGTAKEMLRGMEGQGVLAPISPQESIMYAVKPKGGAFTGTREYEFASPGTEGREVFEDSVTSLVKSGELMPDVRPELKIPIQSRKALNSWVEDKIGNYIRRDMATPNDPFVKAVDEGKKLHLLEDLGNIKPMSYLARRRDRLGFPAWGSAKTPLGRKLEKQIDSSMWSEDIGDVDTYNIHPSMEGFKDTSPNMQVYSPGSQIANRMQFPKMIEGMEDMLTERRYTAYGDTSTPIPQEYQLTPEKLQGLSPVDASEKVGLFNQWRDKERQVQAAQYLDKYGNVYKKYDNGRKWIAMDDLAEEPKQAELVQQAGCLGGWCTRDENFAMEHGSGDKRLHILFDEKATPRVQLTITKREPTIDDFFASEFSSSEDVAKFENKYGNIDNLAAFQIENTPEYQAWVRLQGAPERITEIKGQFDKVDIKSDPNTGRFLKEIQDFVKSKDWGTVSNLDGINMVDLDDYLPTISRGLNREQANQLSNFMKSLNDGSRFADKHKAENILREASMRVFQPPTPPGRAMGGMVERQASTARYI